MNDPIRTPLSVADYSAPEPNEPENPAPPTVVEVEVPSAEEQTPPPPAKKRRRVWPWIVFSLCSLLVVAGATIGGIYYWYTRPDVVLKGGVYNYLEGFVEEYSAVTMLAECTQNGMIHFGVSGNELVGEGKIFENPIEMDLYSDVRRAKAVLNVRYNGKETSIYRNSKEFLVAGGYVGDAVLRVESKEMYQQFTESVFHPSAGNSYVFSLNEYELEALEELLEELEHPAEEEQTNYGEKYIHLLIDELDQHSTATVEQVDGVQTNTYAFTADQLSAYVDAVWEVIEADWKELNPESLDIDLSVPGQTTDPTALLEQVKSGFTDSIEKMKTNEQTATLTIVTAMYPHALERIRFEVSATNDRFVPAPVYEFTVDENHDTLVTRARYGAEDLKISYAAKEGAIEFFVEEKKPLATEMVRTTEVKLDYSQGTAYTLTLSLLVQEITLEYTFSGAILANSEDELRISLDKCVISARLGEYSESAELNFGLQVGCYKNWKMPEFPKATADFFSMTLSDVMNLEKSSDFKSETVEKWLKDYLKQYIETME